MSSQATAVISRRRGGVKAAHAAHDVEGWQKSRLTPMPDSHGRRAVPVSPLEFPPRRADVSRLRSRPQTASRLKFVSSLT